MSEAPNDEEKDGEDRQPTYRLALQDVDDLLDQAIVEDRFEQTRLDDLLRTGSDGGSGYGEANVLYWARMPYWTIIEFAALSFGKNPNLVNWETCHSLQASHPFCRTYMDRCTLIHRSVQVGKLPERITPSDAMDWMIELRLPAPNHLIEAVKEMGHLVFDWPSEYLALSERAQDLENQYAAALDQSFDALQEKDEQLQQFQDWFERARPVFREQAQAIDYYRATLEEQHSLAMQQAAEAEAALIGLATSLEAAKAEIQNLQRDIKAESLAPKSLSTFQKMILGMAKEQYGYDPFEKRSSAISEIADDLKSHGLSLDEKTVRERLFEASEKFPGGDAN